MHPFVNEKLQKIEDHPLTHLGDHILKNLNESLKHASTQEIALALMVNMCSLFDTQTTIAEDKKNIESLFFDREFWTPERLVKANQRLSSTNTPSPLSLEEAIIIGEIYDWCEDIVKALEVVVLMRNQRDIRTKIGGVQSQVTQILEKNKGTTLKIPLVGERWQGIGPIISPHATGEVRIIRGPDGTLWDISLIAQLEHNDHLNFQIEKE